MQRVNERAIVMVTGNPKVECILLPDWDDLQSRTALSIHLPIHECNQGLDSLFNVWCAGYHAFTSLLLLVSPDFCTTFPFAILRATIDHEGLHFGQPHSIYRISTERNCIQAVSLWPHCSNLKVHKSDVQITINSVPWHQHSVLGIHTPLINYMTTDHALIIAIYTIHTYSKCAHLHLLNTHIPLNIHSFGTITARQQTMQTCHQCLCHPRPTHDFSYALLTQGISSILMQYVYCKMKYAGYFHS